MNKQARTISPLTGNKIEIVNSNDCQATFFYPVLKRGLNRKEAAGYVGVSSSLFDELVEDGRMPKPFKINSRVIWDIRLIEDAFNEISMQSEQTDNPWDES